MDNYIDEKLRVVIDCAIEFFQKGGNIVECDGLGAGDDEVKVESVDDLDAKNMNHNVEKIDDNKEKSQTVVMDDVLHVSGPEENEAESANEVEE
ncbi:hypothetical protein Tco_1195593 [Tanacetum coccineum]